MVICGTRGDRVRGPGTTFDRRHRRGGLQSRHQLGQGVGRGCSSRRDDTEYRAARIISGGGVVVVVAGVEPHFVAAAGARHRYNGTVRRPAAVSWVADHLLRSRESIEAGRRRSITRERGTGPGGRRGEASGGDYGCALMIGAYRGGRQIEDRIAADKQIPGIRVVAKAGGLTIIHLIQPFDGPARIDLRDRSLGERARSVPVYFRDRDKELLGAGLPHRLFGAIGRIDAIGRSERDFLLDRELAGRRDANQGAERRGVGVVNRKD